jgi:hypothetical protein
MTFWKRLKKSRAILACPVRSVRPGLEPLEDRTLLSFSAPASIVPSQAAQTLFRLDLSSQAVPHGQMTSLYQFALNGPGFDDKATFDLAPTNGDQVEAALGLYDSDGNLLASSAVGSPAESLMASVQTQRVYEIGVFFPIAPPDDFRLTVTSGPQPFNPIKIDPSTGQASLPAIRLTPRTISHPSARNSSWWSLRRAVSPD